MVAERNDLHDRSLVADLHDESMDAKESTNVKEATTAGSGKRKKKATGSKPTGNPIVTMTALKEQWMELQTNFQESLMGMVDRKLQEVLARNTASPPPTTIQRIPKLQEVLNRNTASSPSTTTQGMVKPPTPTHQSSTSPPSIPQHAASSYSGSQTSQGRIPIKKTWTTKNSKFCHQCRSKTHNTRDCRSRQNG